MMKRGPLKAAFLAASIAAYLGLAIYAWGGFGPFFSHPALTALVVVTVAITWAAYYAGGNVSPGVREDRSSRWVILAVSLAGVAACYLAPLTDRLDFWTLDGDGLRWIGVMLYGLGGGLRLWPVFVLGDRFSGLVA